MLARHTFERGRNDQMAVPVTVYSNIG